MSNGETTMTIEEAKLAEHSAWIALVSARERYGPFSRRTMTMHDAWLAAIGRVGEAQKRERADGP